MTEPNRSPRIISVRHGSDTPSGVVLQLVVPADLYYLQGHFPNCPLLPGVVQLTWAVHFARQFLSVRGEFRAVSGLKFMRVIQPDTPVELTLSFDPAKGALSFEYRNAGVSASGTALFAA